MISSAEREVPGQTMEKTPPHTHNVNMMEKFAESGHTHEHNMYGKHAAGHMKEHDKVKALCGGGMSKK